jgi:RHS repeat-associated protein
MSVGPVLLGRAASSGRLTSTTVGPVTTTYGYSQYGELQTVSAAVSGAVLYTQGIQYDAVGQPIVSEESLSGALRQDTYGNDAIGRLTSFTRNGVTTTYAYGPNGTRVRAGTDIATFDAQDRLLSQGATTYTWDVHGNRAADSTGVTCTHDGHDGLGRLIGWSKAGVSLQYELDALDRRVLRRRNGVVTSRYVYEGQYRVVAELESGSRFLYATHQHSPDAMLRGGVVYVYVKNHLGSIRAVVNASTGQVVQTLDYDAWGNVLADTNPGFQPFAFAGGLYDVDTKLTQFGWRDYDANTGSWSSPEHLLQNPRVVLSEQEDWHQMPAYAYARNNPISYVDPTGLITLDTDSARRFGGPGWAVKWQRILKEAQARASKLACKDIYSRYYGADIESLFSNQSSGPRIFFGDNSWLGKNVIAYANPVTGNIVIDTRWWGTRSDSQLAGDLLHEIAHYANRAAFWPMDENSRQHGGAKQCERTCQ